MPDNLNNKNKDLWTKAMFGVLVFFGFSALILGVMQIGSGLDLSRDNSGGSADEVDYSQLTAGLESDQRTVAEMQATDSDGDGLSNFDEVYVYKTSMYLADSDSDGYTDKEEIDGEYDPNCPNGQDCRGTGADTSQPLTDANEYIQELEQETGGDELPVELKNELNNLTPDELRQLLLESGQLTEEQLDQIDDQTLVKFIDGL